MLTPTMGRGQDVLAVVEASYDLDGTTEEWLSGVAEAAAPHADQGLGVVAWAFEVPGPGRVALRERVTTGRTPAGIDAATRRLADAVLARDPSLLGRCHHGHPVSTFSTNLGNVAQAIPEMVEHYHPLGARDFIGIVAANPCGFGVGIGIPVAEITTPSRAFGRRWGRVAAHVAAGFRLRRGLERALAEDPLSGADAVLSPGGRLEHAEREARQGGLRRALREAAVAIDRARSRAGRSEPDQALECWRGLVPRFH
jgi:hypothetical protein